LKGGGLIWLFDYIYYKFHLSGGLNLQLKLRDLSRDHKFVIINDFGLMTPDINQTYEETIKERFLLVYRADNPRRDEPEPGRGSERDTLT
jgi:hypothetical protein